MRCFASLVFLCCANAQFVMQVECKDIDTSTLGPNTKYVEAAREKRRKEDEERKQKLSKSSRGAVQYTEEEKRQMAAQMMEDARQREEYVAKQAARKSNQLDEDELKASRNPHFLKYVCRCLLFIGSDRDVCYADILVAWVFF